jgi:hypothetical protein
MGDVHLSNLADEGLAELQALIGSARAILAQYANEDDVEVAASSKDAGRGNEDDVKPIDISSDADGSPQPSRDPMLEAFASARDRYLASSKKLRKIIEAIQEKEVLDSVKSEVPAGTHCLSHKECKPVMQWGVLCPIRKPGYGKLFILFQEKRAGGAVRGRGVYDIIPLKYLREECV